MCLNTVQNEDASELLLSPTQGDHHATEYAFEFRTITASSGWTEPVLKAAFHHGLNEDILTELACQDKNVTLDSLIDLAICLDNLLQKHHTSYKKCPMPETIASTEPI